ncbi:Crp/Fnr family transcriptional regulator [Sphingomonas sp. TREG-RG-20F-R18-01]|uniref:Crp/Fnr family transcriptional regulator n=1 Tax=Sphingomonas sp. TREG-RG-20F-R18-01 TaxID=2914982 RepID=UPI001F575E67|nr:Crp/Fnr family transcriptional regulator [Sphingomonas sp. TREG-RG-20F-R18-01]
MMGEATLQLWPAGNGLLDRVSPHDQAKLLDVCELVDLRAGTVLYEPGAPLTHVYFLLSGMVSLIAVMKDGRSVETMTIGREGVIATSASGYVDPAFSRFLVQVPGTAVRTTAQGFEDMVDGSVGLCSAVSRYREVLLRTTLQIVACNAIHTVRQRCARWILTTHDRSGVDLLPLTQASLAEMLGVKRNSISIVTRDLRQLGFIQNTRGMIEVEDRNALEGVACECYELVHQELARILTDDPSPECND